LHEGTLYLVNDNEESSSLMALDAATGEEKWTVQRDERTNCLPSRADLQTQFSPIAEAVWNVTRAAV